MVKDDHFSLFEAVGALEVKITKSLTRLTLLTPDQIGDSKMDSGCLEPGEALEDQFDMEKEFLPDELIWLMDQMLNREVRVPVDQDIKTNE